MNPTRSAAREERSPVHDMRRTSVTGRRGCSIAFTLTELLAVLAIVGLLMALGVPALSSLATAGNINRSTDQVSLMLDLARSEAMSKNTYVWLGLKNETANGGSQLRLAVVRSLDGSSNPTNIRPSAKSVLLEGVKLVGLTDLAGALQSKISSDLPSGSTVDMSAPGTTQSFVAANQTFTAFILFTPEGEALVPTSAVTTAATPFVPCVVIALRSAKGTQLPASDVNGTCIVLKAGNHQQIYRL